ncbi:hypothetical protein J1N35_011490 [Gossypium stocksii]|uniref:Uncharacterized protein n=1 Tax=Gossypium stocksii TaxID=47602 RepID=A0A9D3W2U1_9ROSI|nr:hypothetical protein J1N35_011490 [Gossypium stocksii]
MLGKVLNSECTKLSWVSATLSTLYRELCRATQLDKILTMVTCYYYSCGPGSYFEALTFHAYWPYATDYVELRIKIYVDICTTTDDNIDADAHASIDADVNAQVDVGVPGIWGTL